jgi:hypothetical protein
VIQVVVLCYGGGGRILFVGWSELNVKMDDDELTWGEGEGTDCNIRLLAGQVEGEE